MNPSEAVVAEVKLALVEDSVGATKSVVQANPLLLLTGPISELLIP